MTMAAYHTLPMQININTHIVETIITHDNFFEFLILVNIFLCSVNITYILCSDNKGKLKAKLQIENETNANDIRKSFALTFADESKRMRL